MKVLITAHNRENSGWGRACRDFIKALSKHVDVVVRPIILGDNYIDPEIEKLEQKNLSDITHSIQYCLPNYMSYNGSFDKTVGISLFETNNLYSTNIYNYLSLVDEVWDIGDYIKDNPGIRVRNTKQAFEYSKTSLKIDVPEISGTYKFYFIGSCIKRKNLEGIIRAFFSEFENEPVSLLIKSSVPGVKQKDSIQHINSLVEKVRFSCKKNIYPRIHLIPNYVSDEEIKAIHDFCDCYIDFSYGESINYGLLEAAYYGNDIISTESNFYSDLLKTKQCLTSSEPCYEQNLTFPWYNTCREFWEEPSVSSLMYNMRKSYEEKSKFNYDLSQLSYNNIGKEYLELLIS